MGYSGGKRNGMRKYAIKQCESDRKKNGGEAKLKIKREIEEKGKKRFAKGKKGKDGLQEQASQQPN